MKKTMFPMRKVAMLLLVLVFLTGSSCSDAPRDPSQGAYKEVRLQLNEEEKWEVPDGMWRHLDSSFALLNTEEPPSPAQIASVAGPLKRQQEAFVQQCTMTGDAHKVLHEWLIPYIGLVDKLQPDIPADSLPALWAELRYARELFGDFFMPEAGDSGM